MIIVTFEKEESILNILTGMLFNEPTPGQIVFFLLSNKINILVLTIVKRNKTSSRMVVKVSLCAAHDIFIM